jgi:hypothetical protein
LTFIQQGSPLVDPSVTGPGNQGAGVALSGDGNTALIGGYGDDGGVGAARVFTRSGSDWAQQSKLVGVNATGKAEQGVSVALSGDGNTALVGGQADDSYVGAAWVFTRTGTTWDQQGPKLVGSGVIGAAWEGNSVALSSDGNTALIGGYRDNAGVGAAWVFTRTGTTWDQQGPKLVGSDAIGNAFQGSAVALSGDGNTALIGGSGDDGGVGAAWVFTRSSSAWTQQSKLASGENVAAQQGLSVALSSDGNTALVGAPGANSQAGAAWVFTRAESAWTLQSQLLGSGVSGAAGQGVSVALSNDGNTALLGGPGDDNWTGAAWAFTRAGVIWNQEGSKLVGSGATAGPPEGLMSVALSGDGDTALTGDPFGPGAAWVFVRQ